MKSLDGKSNETDSPKTPGGISKALLTPIRRLGLSRKWKKSGSSPFVSPLSGNVVKNNENGEEKPSRKRKLCADDEIQNLPLSPITDSKQINIEISSTPPLNANTENTPVRKVTTSRVKCKPLMSSPVACDNLEVRSSIVDQNNGEILTTEKFSDSHENKQTEDTELNHNSSNKISKNKSVKKMKTGERHKNIETEEESIKTEDDASHVQSKEMNIIEPHVPNLSKECIVVIQKKIFTPANNEIHSTNKGDVKENNSISQVLFDSDSDDMPLSALNKKDVKQKPENINKNLDDGDIIDTKINNRNKKEISKHLISSISKKAHSSKSTEEKPKHIKKQTLKGKIDQIPTDLSSQKSNYFDDDDDDFELNKKTILIRKSYVKVIKPSKSKSTGSITQKDIDEIKARIEMKKKLLIANSMTKDTEELRGLIKKWRKGCQDALMELLDLMRKKIPDQSNMNYSYILEMLKIPPTLVGYNEENECFNTPDDDSILTATFNDL